MKTLYFSRACLCRLSMIFAVMSPSILLATIIVSTPAGGNWNAAATWQGGTIPAGSDDVIILSGATVSTILGVYNSCNNLTVEEDATLINNGLSNATLTVNGVLLNNGTIRNGASFLTINLYQHLIHQGTEFSNYKIAMQGSVGHNITFGPGKQFTGQYFSVDGTARTITALSDLVFSGTLIDFNGSTLALPVQGALCLSGQSLNEIILTGGNPVLSMRSGAVIYNSTVIDGLIRDTLRNGSNNLFMEGASVIDTNAMVVNFGSSHSIYFNGNLTNHGTVTNGANLLSVYVTGNLNQYGTWNPYATYLSGTADQQVTLAGERWFGGTYFYNTQPTTKTIFALTDLDFRGVIVNFAYGASGGIRGTLSLPEEGRLNVSGAGNSLSLSRINIASTGTTARLYTTSGCYTQSFSNSCNHLILEGTILVGNNEFYLNNEVHVLDTLLNYSTSGHVLYLTGSLHNKGYISDGQATLETNINGNIVHDGTEWSNYQIRLSGTGSRTIRQAPYNRFNCQYFESSSALAIQATTSLVFQETKINLFGSELSFPAGDSLNISGVEARLVNGTISGDMLCKTEDGAWLQSVTFAGNVRIKGWVPVYNNAVFFLASCINEGDLKNQNTTPHVTYMNSSFTNTGTIYNGVGMGNLTLEIKGDIINRGIWSNYENKINGASDQHIRLVDDLPINARCLLVSNLGGSSFQWFKDSVLIPGATSSILTLNSISATDYGLYYCTSSSGQSRIITIASLPVVSFFVADSLVCHPANVSFSDSSSSFFPILYWNWEFGDGSQANAQHPDHFYSDTGSYTVTLTISDGYFPVSVSHPRMVRTVLSPQASFTTQDVCLGTANFFDDQSENILYQTTEVLQYASEVTSFSSQYTDDNWAATEALGPPDVFPDHADNVHAWASLTANGQREYLTLRFPQAVRSTGVIVYETLYPGATDSICLRNEATGDWVLVWSETATPLPLVARALRVTFPLTSFETREVRIAVNSPAVAYWNEIDAVALVSPGETTFSDQTEYQWEMGQGGPDFTTRGDLIYTFPEPGEYEVTLTITNENVCSDAETHTVRVYPHTIGGEVTGSKVIRLGASTGILSLINQTGEVIFWEKRLGGNTWEVIGATGLTFEEFPASVGAWQYRAMVRSGLCEAEYSVPATIVVTKPEMVVWNGSVSYDWMVAGNWTPAYVPDEDVDVLISDVSPNPFPVVTGPATCRNLEIQNQAALTLPDQNDLVVLGDCLLRDVAPPSK